MVQMDLWRGGGGYSLYTKVSKNHPSPLTNLGYSTIMVVHDVDSYDTVLVKTFSDD